jgi:hypothetical protein
MLAVKSVGSVCNLSATTIVREKTQPMMMINSNCWWRQCSHGTIGGNNI